jgi:uncharacterized protein YcaQ
VVQLDAINVLARPARREKPIDPQVRRRILATLRDTGPQTIRQLRGCEAAGSGWAWGPTKLAVARLIWTGELVCVTAAAGNG